MSKNPVVLYHAKCADGFGAAYAAWKKFGDKAAYLPVRDRKAPPPGLAGKDVYILDFSYPSEVFGEIERTAKSLLVIDHHKGAEAEVRAVRNHVFDLGHSGAVLSWNHFHPAVPAPKILLYVEDADLWKFSLPHAKEMSAVIHAGEFSFERWDALARELETSAGFARHVEEGRAFRRQWNDLVREAAEYAEEVEFEGYRIYAVNASRMFRSDLGHLLALKKGPFSIVYYFYGGEWHYSLRGDGSVDLTEIARKYGGSGHRDAAAFDLPPDAPPPFRRAR